MAVVVVMVVGGLDMEGSVGLDLIMWNKPFW